LEDSLLNELISKLKLLYYTPKYLPLNNRHIFGRLFFDYTSLLFIAIVKTITKNNAPSTQKISAPKNDDYLMLGTYYSIEARQNVWLKLFEKLVFQHKKKEQ
jgi:hypothetical protein